MNTIIDQLDLGQEIISGTQEVFSTMLMLNIAGTDISAQKGSVTSSNLTSMIGLGGGIRGMLAVHCPGSVARFITGSFLGMEVKELDDDVKDAIGEISNMVAGNLKTSFASAGIDIELAIPTSSIGQAVRLTGISGSTHHTVAFQIDGSPFWIELLYTLS